MTMLLDHIALLVGDTEEALTFYRDQLGLKVTASESFDETGVRLTHLDLGNIELQLVEPLTPDHPLRTVLDEKGEGLHHLCLRTPDLEAAVAGFAERGIRLRAKTPHPAVNGKKALFLNTEDTRGVIWEMTNLQQADS